MKLPVFTKDRREGHARSSDNLGTTALAAAVLSVSRPGTATTLEIALLFTAALVAYANAFFLRKESP
jgi:hypothetical protein